MASPPSSAPRTLKVAVIPVTGLGDALAGVTTVGAVLAMARTVTDAVPVLPLAAADTVKGPPAELPAVKRPALEIVPPPDTVQVKVEGVAMAAPN